MAAQEYVNPRFSITVRSDILPVIERYAEINGLTRARSVSKILETLAPMMQVAIEAHDKSEVRKEEALNKLHRRFAQYISDDIQKNIDLSFKGDV